MEGTRIEGVVEPNQSLCESRAPRFGIVFRDERALFRVWRMIEIRHTQPARSTTKSTIPQSNVNATPYLPYRSTTASCSHTRAPRRARAGCVVCSTLSHNGTVSVFTLSQATRSHVLARVGTRPGCTCTFIFMLE